MSDAFGDLREALSARPMDVDAVLDALAQVHNDQMIGAQAMVIRALAEEVKRRPVPIADKLKEGMKAESTYGVIVTPPPQQAMGAPPLVLGTALGDSQVNEHGEHRVTVMIDHGFAQTASMLTADSEINAGDMLVVGDDGLVRKAFDD